MAAPEHFSNPPPASALDPSSLRGEALAYLVSGQYRLFGGPPGAAWFGPDGKVESLPGLFALLPSSVSRSPRLDLFRLRLLDYLWARRAPAAPAVPSAPSARAWSAGGRDYVYPDWWNAGSQRYVPVPPAFPPWGRSWDVAADQASLDAAGGAWLSPSASRTPADDFALAGVAAPASRALAAFMASVSGPQPAPVLGAGCGFSSGYVPGADPPQASPEPLLASDVDGLFARPPSDPAAMTRRWFVRPGWLFGVDPDSEDSDSSDSGVAPDSEDPDSEDPDSEDSSDSSDSGFAPDFGGPCSFRFVMHAERNVDPSAAVASLRDEWAAKWAEGGELAGGEDVAYACQWSGSEVYVSPLNDAVFRAWAASRGGVAGPASFSGAVRYAYVAQVTGKDPPPERPDGNCWLVDSMTDMSGIDDPDNRWPPYDGAVIPFVSQAPFRPMNYAPARTAPYYAATGASQAGRFGIVYAYARPGRGGAARPVPATGPSPFAAGHPVPVPCADDVAAQPAFVASVRRLEHTGCDDGELPYDSVREWAVAGFVPGCGRWTRDAGSPSGAWDGQSEFVLPPTAEGLAEFVAETVLPACGIDPAGLLRGNSSWKFVSPPGARTLEVVKLRRDAHGDWAETASVPAGKEADLVLSGDAVEASDVVVDVDLPACVFESGYCA